MPLPLLRQISNHSALLSFSSMVNLPANYQSVYTSVFSQALKAGQTLDFPIFYTASDPALSGLTLNIIFNSSLLELSSYSSSISAPISGVSILEDSANLDQDPLTDKIIQFAWGTFNNSFPSIALPAIIANIKFKVANLSTFASPPKSTALYFYAPETAIGYEFLHTDPIVPLNASPTPVDGGNGTIGSITSSSAGVFQEGVTLTAPAVTGDPDGDATNPNPVYQWFRNGTAISNANGATYQVPSSGAGTYKVAVTYSDAQGFRSTVVSAEKVVTINKAPTGITASSSSFLENITAGAVVATLSSIDPDRGNTFTYELVNGTGSIDNAAFTISGNQLKIAGSPDFEVKNSYSIRIKTVDQAGLFFEKSIAFAVTNVNEAPTNLLPTASSFNENIAAGAIIASFSSTDPDASNSFAYSLVSSAAAVDNAAFTIVGNQIKINASPNYEKKSSYSIRVRTTDQGKLFFEKDITFTVGNLNEAPSNLIPSASSFNEKIPAGSVVATLSSTDPDADNTFTYSLISGTGSTDNSSFTISRDQLAIKNSPDFKAKKSYSIRVRTTDQNGLFFEKNLVFAVNKLNEAPTNLVASASAFKENIAAGTVVATLSSTDPDLTPTFTYTLIGGTGSTDNAAFTISGNQLKIIESPDFEAKSSYSLRVRTTDQAGLFLEKNLAFTVTNLNEAPINIATSVDSFNEGVGAGSTVAILEATDPDINSTFIYSFIAGDGSSDNGAFLISGNQLKIKAVPDFESKSTYNLRIRATDQTGLFIEKKIILKVNDITEVKTSISTRLEAGIIALELTGSKNIFGMGNDSSNQISGNSGHNKLTGGLGKDILTGGLGNDTFFYAAPNESLLAGYDIITDYTGAESIVTGFDIEGDRLIAAKGAVTALTEGSISTLLTPANFAAHSVSVFTAQGVTGAFVAINDQNAGFQASSDAIIHLLNYNVNAANPVTII